MTEYPKNYQDNIKFRAQLMLKCAQDPNILALTKRLFFEDVLFAFNVFFYTLDVRKRPQHQQPFCTYGYQDEAILELVDYINRGEDLGYEKSRDMGCSWLVILVMLWFWLNPEGGADFLLGSRIEDYVDKKGDMRTLIEKARYALYKLPKWLLPEGFRKSKHDNFMRLTNPKTGSSITGESNNPNFSTGGRYAAVLFDEFAKWEVTDTSAWTAAGDATPCRIPVSTAFGASGKFYEIVTDGQTKKIRLHWSLHPEKAEGLYCVYPLDPDTEEPELRSPWYDKECQRRSPSEIRQELDIDYLGSGNPVFEGKAAKRLRVLLKAKKDPAAYMSVDLATDAVSEIQKPRDNEGILVVYEKPDPKKSYVHGVDVIEGKEWGDFAVLKTMCRETKMTVASYAGRIDEVQLARIINNVNKWYGVNSWIGIETNGPGLATFDLCYVTYGLTNLFMMPQFDSAKGAYSYSKGWRTTSTSRNVLIAGIKEWLQESGGWTDPRCLRELTTFVYQGTPPKAQAKAGSNDDEVIAHGICIQVDVIAPYEAWEATEILREDGLSKLLFVPQKTGEEPTIEERCLESVLAKKAMKEDMLENMGVF